MPPINGYRNDYTEVNLPVSEVPKAFADAGIAYYKTVGEHEEKFEKVKSQVVEFLRGSASLNEALKKYPDIALHVPQKYLDRIEMKATAPSKDTKAKPEVEIDRDLITSMGVLGHLQKKGE